MGEAHREACLVLLASSTVPHLRSYLRTRPDFDPSLEEDRQPGLGHVWAKQFWDKEHEKGTPPAQWFESWTNLKCKTGTSSTDSQETATDAWYKLTEGYEASERSFSLFDDSFEEDKKSGTEESGSTNVIKFVASAAALDDEDWRGRLSGRGAEIMEKAVEEAILRDQRCFQGIRKCVQRAIRAEEKPHMAVATGNPLADRLGYIKDYINQLFDWLMSKMKGTSLIILRPMDRFLEAPVREAHTRSRVAEGLSELLDELDAVLLALGVPAPRGETVTSDRLVHQFLYRLSDCRERVMTHRKNADLARQMPMARRAGPSSELSQRRGPRYVSRPLSLAPALPDGTNSRASSASAGSPIAATPIPARDDDGTSDQSILEHQPL